VKASVANHGPGGAVEDGGAPADDVAGDDMVEP
jgi:hypothetical protein